MIKPRLLVSILLSLSLGVACLLFVDGIRALTQPFGNAERVTFELKRGVSLSGGVMQLHQQGLIAQARDVYYLKLYGRLSGAAGQLQAGEYDIQPGTNALRLFGDMLRGEVRQYQFTIVEGWSLRQLLQALKADPVLLQSEPALTIPALQQALGIKGHPEGWFFPDTYQFSKGSKDIEILRRAYTTMQAVLDAEWQSRSQEILPYKTPYEALIMASIIEKETAVASERQQIAGVFVRRLQKGMRLQTDPTVIYGMGERFQGNIRRADLRRATPYNTYTQYGLPPTPIAMPGQAAIHAALHPATGDSLYFVARGDGSHAFSATLKAHNAAVRKYQLQKKSGAKE